MTTLQCSHGHLNPADSRFCRLCGEALPSLSPTPPPGTELLAWRYRITSELAQGGFGRTYLAEDTHRFNESCVLKEFAPQVQGTQALQKAEELFAREAGILYKLQHPQIPQFRELFRAEWQGRDRLFLVQDYVTGQTYEAILKQRLQRGDRFTEAEIIDLWRQLLPVLDYIHGQGVIHRDIAPDNLIQRSPDGLPVLIDFGGVKQIAAQMVSELVGVPASAAPTTATRLGKVGYAPAEQLEQGIVHPHSDLYALAMTSLVLLLGKEPAEIFTHQGNFNRQQWQQDVPLRPAVIAIAARMLEPYPEKRYPSAQAVLQALELACASPAPPLPLSNAPHPAPVSPLSAAATIAVSPKHRPAAKPNPAAPPAAQPAVASPAPVPRSAVPWRIPSALVNTVIFVAFIAGGWWAGVKWIGPALKPLLPEITRPSSTKPGSSDRPTGDRATVDASEQARKQQIDEQRSQLGIDAAFLMQFVNTGFYAKHPERAGNPLGTGAADASLRQVWDELALTALQRFAALSPEARSRLGAYTTADLQARQAAALDLHLGRHALNDLTDAAFFHQFPDQSRVGNLLDQPMGQVWHAIATDQLRDLQTGKSLEVIEVSTAQPSRHTGTLAPGTGKAYIANLTAQTQVRLQLQSSDPAVLLSFYPPTSDRPPFLADSQATEWSGELPSSGFYEITIVAANRPATYTLELTTN